MRARRERSSYWQHRHCGVFFFFKQKTAYEMRISDWSSDVCSSDLAANYNRQENGEWVTDTHWNEVTLFGKLIERGGKAQKGDLVHITGRVRQNSYDTAEGRRYTVELIADGFAVLAKGSEDRD